MKKSRSCEQLLDGFPGNSFGSKYEDDQPSRNKSATKDEHPQSTEDVILEGGLLMKAEIYLEYMKQIQIPAYQHSIIPFSSWQGLAKSMKKLYRQPLHYLTNILLRNWDISRMGSDDEYQPLDMLIHPAKAEAIIWATEEVHRRTTSGQYLANIWSSDPLYHAYIDPIFFL